MALSPQNMAPETPPTREGAQKHPAMGQGHGPTWPLGGTQPRSLFSHSTHPQTYPCPTEPSSSPTPTVLILNPTDPSLPHGVCPQLHSAYPQCQRPIPAPQNPSPAPPFTQNLSGNTHPCKAVLGTACLDDLLGEPLLPPAARPAHHHAQVDPSQSSEAGQASSAGPALQVTHPLGVSGGSQQETGWCHLGSARSCTPQP